MAPIATLNGTWAINVGYFLLEVRYLSSVNVSGPRRLEVRVGCAAAVAGCLHLSAPRPRSLEVRKERHANQSSTHQSIMRAGFFTNLELWVGTP